MIIACKLPTGLSINHGGQTININGANSSADPLMPLPNGAETHETPGGYGLTELNDDQAKAFEDWRLHAMFKRDSSGTPAEKNGKLDEYPLYLDNGALMTFKSDGDARKELRGMNGVQSGFGGLDGDAEVKNAAAGSELKEAGTAKK